MKAKFKSKNFNEIEMSDSDSGDDALVDSVLVFENNDTIIHAGRKANNNLPKGRPANSVHIVRNTATSCDEMPRNFMRKQHLGNNSLQRNMVREHSPMSVRSEARSLNYRGFSQQSIADGAESMISEAPSNISCAADIVTAIKCGQYSFAEAKVINEAVIQRFGKKSLRMGGIRKNNRNKKRSLKKLITALMNALDEHSDQSSNVSSSSEDRLSDETSNRGKRNYAASLYNYPTNKELCPPKTNITKSSSIGGDRTKSLQQDFRNIYAKNMQKSLNASSCIMPPPSSNIIPMRLSKPKSSKDNRTTENGANKENSMIMPPANVVPICNSTLNTQNSESAEEIQEKVYCVEKLLARSKTVGELSKEPQTPVQKEVTEPTGKNNDEDNFVKPNLPDRLSNPINDSNQSKSHTNVDENSDLTKSSFLRRKLFTQTLDITKNKAVGDAEEVVSNSPLVNIYRSKKNCPKSSLAMSNMDDDGKSDEQEILELVKKIVPPAEMEIITAPTNNRERSEDSENFSDTYTDDEDLFRYKKKPNDTCVEKSSLIDKVHVPRPQVAPKAKVPQLNTRHSNRQVSSIAKKVNDTIRPVKKVNNATLNCSKIAAHKINNCNVTRRAAAFWETDTENDTTLNDTNGGPEESLTNVSESALTKNGLQTLQSQKHANKKTCGTPTEQTKPLIVNLKRSTIKLQGGPEESLPNVSESASTTNGLESTFQSQKHAIKKTSGTSKEQNKRSNIKLQGNKTNDKSKKSIQPIEKIKNNKNLKTPIKAINSRMTMVTRSSTKKMTLRVSKVNKPRRIPIENIANGNKTKSKGIQKTVNNRQAVTKASNKTSDKDFRIILDFSNDSLNSSYFTRGAKKKLQSLNRKQSNKQRNILNTPVHRKVKETIGNNNNKNTPVISKIIEADKSREQPQEIAKKVKQDKNVNEATSKEIVKPVKRKLAESPVKVSNIRNETQSNVDSPNKRSRIDPIKKTNNVTVNKSSYKCVDKPFDLKSHRSLRHSNKSKIDDDCGSVVSNITTNSVLSRRRVLMHVP